MPRTKANKQQNLRHRQSDKSCFDRLTIGSIVGFIIIIGVMYFMLLGPEHTFLSLNVILKRVDHLPSKLHLIAVSLIPIYLSFLVFGGGTIGGIIGHHFHKFFSKWHYRRLSQKT